MARPKQPSPGGQVSEMAGSGAGPVGWWVRGTRHLHDLPEGYRTTSPGARLATLAGGWAGRVRPGPPHGRAMPGRGDDARGLPWLGSATASRQREGTTTPGTPRPTSALLVTATRLDDAPRSADSRCGHVHTEVLAVRVRHCNPPCPVVDLISTNGLTEGTAWTS